MTNPTDEQLIAANRAARDADSEWRSQFHRAHGESPKVALFSDKGKGLNNPKSPLAKAWCHSQASTSIWLQLMDQRIASRSQTPSTPAT